MCDGGGVDALLLLAALDTLLRIARLQTGATVPVSLVRQQGRGSSYLALFKLQSGTLQRPS